MQAYWKNIAYGGDNAFRLIATSYPGGKNNLIDLTIEKGNNNQWYVYCENLNLINTPLGTDISKAKATAIHLVNAVLVSEMLDIEILIGLIN